MVQYFESLNAEIFGDNHHDKKVFGALLWKCCTETLIPLIHTMILLVDLLLPIELKVILMTQVTL